MSVHESVLISAPTNAFGTSRWAKTRLTAWRDQPISPAPSDTLATPPRVAPIADQLPWRSAYANSDEITMGDTS